MTVFMGGFVFVVGQLIMNNDFRFFFGVPVSASLLFILPLFIVILASIILLVCVALWLTQQGSIWGRLYYSSVTFAAMVIAVLLSIGGLVTALFL